MRVVNHGIYPYKMGCWVPAYEMSVGRAFEMYEDLIDRVNQGVPSKEKKRLEAKTPEKFDADFINNAFRIISSGEYMSAIYKHDFKYTLICAEAKTFNVAWREHYSGKPQRIADY